VRIYCEKNYLSRVFTVGLLGLLAGSIPLKVTPAGAETTDASARKPETSHDVVADSKIADDSISLGHTQNTPIGLSDLVRLLMQVRQN
jgi:hypothetical protein